MLPCPTGNQIARGLVIDAELISDALSRPAFTKSKIGLRLGHLGFAVPLSAVRYRCSFAQRQIAFPVRMVPLPIGAVSITHRQTPLALRVANVVGLSSGKQMLWADTRRVVAAMTDDLIVAKHAVLYEVRNPMSELVAAGHPDPTVSKTIGFAQPFITTRERDRHNSRIKPFAKAQIADAFAPALLGGIRRVGLHASPTMYMPWLAQ